MEKKKKPTVKELLAAGGYRTTMKIDHISPFGSYHPSFRLCIVDPEKHPFYKIIETLDPKTFDVEKYDMHETAVKFGLERSFATIDLKKVAVILMKEILATVPYDVKKNLSTAYLDSVYRALYSLMNIGTGAQWYFYDLFMKQPIQKEMVKVTFKDFRVRCLVLRELNDIPMNEFDKKFEDEYIHLLTQSEVDYIQSLSMKELFELAAKDKAKLTA